MFHDEIYFHAGGTLLPATQRTVPLSQVYRDLILENAAEWLAGIGIERPEEMAENIAIWEQDAPLTEEDEHELERLRALLGDKFCRGCGYCMPCPQEINIHIVSFLKVLSRQMPRDKVATPGNTEAAERARHCTECRECVEKCPYSLDIPEMLKDNVAYYETFAGHTV